MDRFAAPAQHTGLMRAILDGYPGPIWAKDASGVIVFSNGPAAALFGLEPSEMLGKHVGELHTNPAEVLSYEAADRRVLETGAEDVREVTFTVAGAEPRYFQTTRRRITGGAGEHFVVLISMERTAARRAERAAEEMRARWTLTLDGLRDGVWYWDLVTRSVSFSPRWKSMLGYAADELEDSFETFESLIHPDDRVRMQESVRAHLVCREPYELELSMRHKSGEYRIIHIRGQASWDESGRPLMMSGSHSDVTEERRNRMEREAALRRAEEASKIKSQFLANMSHEIRTPMNGVIGLTALALDGELSPQTRELLESAQTSAQQLLTIINDILDLSKIEAGKMTIDDHPFVLRDVVNHIAAVMRPEANAKGLELIVDVAPDVPQVVAGDAGRVRQIVTNLLGNAVKFTDTGRVRVAVVREESGAEQSSEPRICIRVEDTGIGIAEDKLNSIFLPFSQADTTTTRRFGGTGLGLTICRELALRMHGDIRASSEPGRGSTFEAILALPAVCDAVPVSTTEPARGADGSGETEGIRVLLAEDNPVNARVATLMLQKLGCVVTHAHDGREALALFGGSAFDVVLLDVQMPIMDGMACARAIRASEAAGQYVPIIALTANAMKGDEEPCFAAGMDGYLTKPINRTALRTEIMRARTSSAKKLA